MHLFVDGKHKVDGDDDPHDIDVVDVVDDENWMLDAAC
jgi:hypothetical protein